MRLFRPATAALLLASLAVTSLGITGLGTAHAADRRVEIINKTGQALTHFYASNSGTSSWQEDILGRDVVADGDSVTININDGTGACTFDFKAVFQSGASLEKGGINVCEVSSYTYLP